MLASNKEGPRRRHDEAMRAAGLFEVTALPAA